MKSILIIFFLVLAVITTRASYDPPYRQSAYPPITDTLQWLKANIEQRNSYFVGKPLSVLLDTLAAYGLHDAIKQYTAPLTSDNETNGLPTSTTKDMQMSDIFSPVEGICRPYIVQSVSVGEY